LGHVGKLLPVRGLVAAQAEVGKCRVRRHFVWTAARDAEVAQIESRVAIQFFAKLLQGHPRLRVGWVVAQASENGRKAKRKKTWSRKAGATILTAERRKTILDAISVGVPLPSACALARVTDRTLRRATAKSEEFAAEVRAAESRLKMGLTSQILIAAKNGTWCAAAWMLERRWPAEFARIERTEVSGPGGMPLAISSSSHDEYVRAVRRALGFWDNPPAAGKSNGNEPAVVEALPVGPLPSSVVGEVIDVRVEPEAKPGESPSADEGLNAS
jgi:hypothetical protein